MPAPKVIKLQDPYAQAAERFELQDETPGERQDYQPLNVLGEIKEKGFSNAPPTLLPITVLPFPVARHRSHGPHWTPLPTSTTTSSGVVDDHDEEATVDGRATAKALKRAPKKTLNLQNWKEVLSSKPPQQGASPTTVTTARDSVTKAKVTELNEEQKLPSCPASSGRSGTNDHAGDKKLVAELNAAHTDEEVEQNPPYGFSRPVSNRENDSGRYGKTGVHSSKQLVEEIDSENRAKVFSMTPAEIQAAQSELAERLGADKLNMLRKRGLEKQRRSQGKHEVVKAPAQHEEENKPVKESPPETTSAESSWTQRVEAVKLMRFDLNGDVIVSSTGNDTLTAFQNAAQRDFLRAEGDPAAHGYTITEAAALSRSTVSGQRVAGLQLLTSILNKAMNGLLLQDSRADWQAIWAYALGPHPQLPLTLRIALDDTHVTALAHCAKALQALLSCSQNETYFDTSEAVWPGGPLYYTAPIFRKPVSQEDGWLGGGFWKYNVKSTEILPQPSSNNEDDNKVSDDETVASKDVAAGLLRMGILPRIRYILEVEMVALAEEPLLSVIIGLVRHSPAAADAVMNCPRLVNVIQSFLLREDCLESTRMKAIELLKVLSQVSRPYCLQFSESGILQTVYSVLFRSSSKSLPSIENSARVTQALRLWKTCVNHGIGVELFADFYAVLCTWLSPSVDAEPARLLLAKECYAVLEVLARKLPVLKQQRQDVESGWSWSMAVPVIQNSLSWLVSTDLVIQKLDVLGSVLHFLATACERVQGDESAYTWLPEFVPEVGLALARTELLSGKHSLISTVLRSRGKPTENMLALASCLRSALRLASAVDELLASAKTSNETVSESEAERVLHRGLMLSAKEELKKLMVLALEVDKHTGLMKEYNGRGGPAPGIGVGWGSSAGGVWSQELLLVQVYASILMDMDGVLQISLKSKLRLCSVITDPEVLQRTFSGCIFSAKQWSSTLEVAVKSLRRQGHAVDLSHVENSREVLIQHYSQLWLKRKESAAARKKLATIEEEEGDTKQAVTLREWNKTRLPLPPHWLVSPMHLVPQSEGVESDAELLSRTVLAGLLLLLGLESGCEDKERSMLSRKVHSLSTVFCAGDLFLEEATGEALKALQNIYGRCEGKLDFQNDVASNYPLFAEKLALHFAAASYGDVAFGRQLAFYFRPEVSSAIQQKIWETLAEAKILSLLPTLEECAGDPFRYLDPPKADIENLDMYVSSWTSGGLDLAFLRRALPFRLALHHISSFIFRNVDETVTLHRKRLARKIIRSANRNMRSKEMLHELLHYLCEEATEGVERNKSGLKDACREDSTLDKLWKAMESGV